MLSFYFEPVKHQPIMSSNLIGKIIISGDQIKPVKYSVRMSFSMKYKHGRNIKVRQYTSPNVHPDEYSILTLKDLIKIFKEIVSNDKFKDQDFDCRSMIDTYESICDTAIDWENHLGFSRAIST